ncbi:hypothetical protein V6Z12_A01G093700 [Gossypium hirsutum]
MYWKYGSYLTELLFWPYDDKNFIERSLADSEKVQMEDIRLCEGVQKGIESPAYSTGRNIDTCVSVLVT